MRRGLAAKAPATVADVQDLPVAGGTAAARMRDVAQVRLAHDMAAGVADFGGLPAVGGVVVARRGCVAVA